MKRILLIMLLPLLFFSCQQKEVVEDYVSLSVAEFTFDGSGKDSVIIAVSSNVEWSMSVSEDWIEVYNFKEDSVVVKVLQNTSGFFRVGTVAFLAENTERSLLIKQYPDYFHGRMEELDYMTGYAAMSENGNYVCGVRDNGDEAGYIPVLVNTITGERKELSVKESSYVTAVTNDGEGIIYSTGGVYSSLYMNDEKIEIAVPSELYENPYVSHTNGDFSVAVGYCRNKSTKITHPVIWKNWEPEILDMPTEDLMGNENRNGCYARGCSSDGSVVYGQDAVVGSFGVMYWIDGSLKNIAKETCEVKTNPNDHRLKYVCGLRMENEKNNMSYDGKWLVSVFRYYDVTEESGYYPLQSDIPVIIDTEIGIIEEIPNIESGRVFTVTDDCTVFGGIPYTFSSEGFVYVRPENKLYALDEWFETKYGVILSSNRVVERVSSDGKVFFGTVMVDALPQPWYFPWYLRVE